MTPQDSPAMTLGGLPAEPQSQKLSGGAKPFFLVEGVEVPKILEK